MDEIKMEREIKEMLHQCADELHARVICGANALWRLPLSLRLR